MEAHTALTWSWLNLLTKKRYDVLRDVYGDLDAALQHLNEDLFKSLGCREDTMMKVMNRAEEFDVHAYENELKKRGLALISIEDETYPSRLKEIGDPPVFLYKKGSLDILDQPCIALVGKREMSDYGERVTNAFVPPLVRSGMVTVSGLALGIDAEVAKETIAAGGKTVACLGHGLGQIYPTSNAALAEEIVATGGLLLSEFPLDVSPDKHTFPARNRIIAGLSLGTIALEAGAESGALITADLALDYGRESFAVPGQIFDPQYEGCHQIISSGQAKLVSSPQAVLQELGIIASEKETVSSFVPQSDEESSVFGILTAMPQSVTELTERSGLPAGTINAALTMMELSGGVKNVGNGMWVRA